MKMRRASAIPAILFMATMLVSSQARAALVPPPPTLGEITAAADDILLLKRGAAGTWIVDQVLAGGHFKPGDEPKEEKMFPLGLPQVKDDVTPLTECLVFVQNGSVDDDAVRVVTAAGKVFRPIPGRCELARVQNRTWDETLKAVTAMTADFQVLRKMESLDIPAERNAALLKWLTDHSAEIEVTQHSLVDHEKVEQTLYFGNEDKHPDVPDRGYIHWEFFHVIFSTRRMEDCWSAAKLLAQMDIGVTTRTTDAAFDTPVAGDFLLKIILDQKAALADRKFAAGIFGDRDWYHASIATREQAVQQARALLDEPGQPMLNEAVAMMTEASVRSENDPSLFSTLDILIPLYKSLPDSKDREILLACIQIIGGVDAANKANAGDGARQKP